MKIKYAIIKLITGEEIFSQVPEFKGLDFSNLESGVSGLGNKIKDIIQNTKRRRIT